MTHARAVHRDLWTNDPTWLLDNVHADVWMQSPIVARQLEWQLLGVVAQLQHHCQDASLHIRHLMLGWCI